jgi:hypothetical protein
MRLHGVKHRDNFTFIIIIIIIIIIARALVESGRVCVFAPAV